MRIQHFSCQPITFDAEHKYVINGWKKPPGFWVSVHGERDWLDFCRNNYSMDDLAYVHEVVLKASANVLVLDTEEKLEEFNSLFADREGERIQWESVMVGWDGLIIAPYCWGKKLEFPWYYGWDCASGVIWNLHVIERVEPGQRV